jgi:hypothetical protein
MQRFQILALLQMSITTLTGQFEAASKNFAPIALVIFSCSHTGMMSVSPMQAA